MSGNTCLLESLHTAIKAERVVGITERLSCAVPSESRAREGQT